MVSLTTVALACSAAVLAGFAVGMAAMSVTARLRIAALRQEWSRCPDCRHVITDRPLCSPCWARHKLEQRRARERAVA